MHKIFTYATYAQPMYHDILMWSHEVSRKTDIFYRLGKKTKNMSQTGLILGTQFCLFYGDHTKVRFPIKQLGVHLQCGDARAGNYFGFFFN